MSSIELSIGTWRFSAGRVPPSPADLHRIYDAAWQWHPIVSLLGYHRAYVQLFEDLVDDGWLAPGPTKMRVLDCGIGTAGFSLALSRCIPHGLEIHGVDISPRMVGRARANLRRWRPTQQSEVRYGDIHRLSYPEGMFDLVMGAHVIEHSNDPIEALGELVRVSRPGAPVLFVTSRSHRLNMLHALRWRYHPIGAGRLAALMEQCGVTGIREYRLGPHRSLPGLCSEAVIGRKTWLQTHYAAQCDHRR
ncbi:MAG: class I SAM-dependent methyltransferase [Opitutae bacterium]|nr:class I SAM-dependent methyltransferase [Opitutae bacterium]